MGVREPRIFRVLSLAAVLCPRATSPCSCLATCVCRVVASAKTMADAYKRSAKFTSTFQEPGGAFRMYQDSSLGSYKRQEKIKALHEEKRAKILADRQARIQVQP